MKVEKERERESKEKNTELFISSVVLCTAHTGLTTEKGNFCDHKTLNY